MENLFGNNKGPPHRAGEVVALLASNFGSPKNMKFIKSEGLFHADFAFCTDLKTGMGMVLVLILDGNSGICASARGVISDILSV